MRWLLHGEIGSTAPPPTSLRAVNAVGYLALIFVNVASQTGLFGPTNAAISRRFSTPLTPAGWAFGIWGFIFALQGLGTIYQLLPHGYQADSWKARIVNAIGYGWVLGWLFEMAWQLLFLLLSPLGMWLCLFALLAAFVSFAATLRNLYRLKHACGPLSNVLLYAFFFLPTSVNTAWLSVASGLGALIVPVSYGITDNMDIYTVVVAAVITVLGIAVVHKERDSAYGLTLVWALVAVYGHQTHSALVRGAALVCISIISTLVVLAVTRRKPVQAGDEGAAPEMRPPVKARHSDLAA
ncbi:hypothetical protein WJX81_001126 [Elliptochloris bilobata]|uniref:Tryptophan-rich sensory protein n=1 Tax=Elliptochloris bilobata TaxID=381761 RepID=A0AAW1SEG2_9CHLO